MFNADEQNRRRFPRAKYSCQLTAWRTDGASSVFLTTTENIGAGGVRIFLGEPVPVLVELDIKIDFTQPTIPFKCKGKVLRCQKTNSNLYDISIEFQNLDEVKQAFLYGKVAEIIEKEGHGE